jgi:hypothetical protein
MASRFVKKLIWPAWKALRRVVLRFHQPPPGSSPYEGRFVDHLLREDWGNLVVRAVSLRTKIRRNTHPGVTIVMVNFNTIEKTIVAIAAVQEFSPPGTEILLVDNGSSDGSKDWMRSLGSPIRTLFLPFNLGHGRAVDIALHLVKTEVTVIVDSDAFPLNDRWLNALVRPISDQGLAAVGARGRRDRLHPAFLAVDTKVARHMKVSFASRTEPGVASGDAVFGETKWDVGEWFSNAIPDSGKMFLNTTSSAELAGDLIGDVGYHLGGGSWWFDNPAADPRGTGGIASNDERWRRSISALLPNHIAKKIEAAQAFSVVC